VRAFTAEDVADAIERREGARAEALAREHARLARSNLGAVLGDEQLKERVPGLALIAGSS
jgi:GntR family transcriptional regulator of vanillate catabolism